MLDMGFPPEQLAQLVAMLDRDGSGIVTMDSLMGLARVRDQGLDGWSGGLL